MNMLKFIVLLISAGAATSALACDYPPLVTIPSGTDATMEELVATQAGIQEYMGAMEEYLTCVDDELTAAGDGAPAEYRAIQLSRYNAAIAEMEAIAADFNTEVQAFRAANPDAG